MPVIIAVKLNESVLAVLGAENVQGFEKSYQIANSIQFLKENLTDEYMKPIMSMQGSRLGFKTDKDKDGGYPLKVVKECLIDAVLSGVNPHGNQFNIIAGNMYVTKEGYGHLLGKIKGLRYSIKHGVPRIDASKQFAIVESTVKWSLNGEQREEKLEFSIKGSRLRMLNGNSGEVDSITLNCIDDAEFMTNLYFALLKRYFAFRVNDGLSNITRMKHVELFDTSDCNYSIKMFHDSHESDRSTKIFIKKIESYNCEVRKLKAYKNMTDEKMFWLGDQYLQSVLDYYNKQDFYEKKVKDKVD